MKTVGTIDRIKNRDGSWGRWRFRVSLGGKEETVGYYDTEDAAKRDQKKYALTRGDLERDYEGLTLEKFGRRILTRREVKREVRNPTNDWSLWNSKIAPDPIAKLAVRRIRTDQLYRWMARLEEKGLATSTMRCCRVLLSVILDNAVEEGLLQANPCRGLRIRGGKAAAPWTYLQPREVDNLLSVVSGMDAHIIAFAIGTGLRAGELCALRCEDVQVKGPKPHVVVRYGKPPNGPTKTGTVRKVPLFGMALTAVEMRNWGWWSSRPNPHGLLFPTTNGAFRDPKHVLGRPAGESSGDVWKEALRAAGITRRFRWHDLRHTCASSLVSGWWGRCWSLEEVRELLGHTTITLTQRYAHMAESALEQAGAETQAAMRRGREGGDDREATGSVGAVRPGVREEHAALAPDGRHPDEGAERSRRAVGRGQGERADGQGPGASTDRGGGEDGGSDEGRARLQARDHVGVDGHQVDVSRRQSTESFHLQRSAEYRQKWEASPPGHDPGTSCLGSSLQTSAEAEKEAADVRLPSRCES